MAIAKKSLTEFVECANKKHIVGDYQERWHHLGRGLAKTLAEKMGIPRGSYRVTSCKGHPYGEIIFHSDWLYIQFGLSCFGGETRFMYRTCDGLWDFTGGINRFMGFNELLDLDKVAEKLLECKGEV